MPARDPAAPQVLRACAAASAEAPEVTVALQRGDALRRRSRDVPAQASSDTLRRLRPLARRRLMMLRPAGVAMRARKPCALRSEEHTSELQSRGHPVCRLLLAKKKGAAQPPHAL